ncbi:hypothetical protein F8M41_017569, partial [Gigaspora margarita]
MVWLGRRMVSCVDDFPDFPKFARESTTKFPNSFFIDRVKESYLDKEDILDLLEKHIKLETSFIGNILVFHRDQLYRRCFVVRWNGKCSLSLSMMM